MSISSIQYPKKQPKNFSIDDISVELNSPQKYFFLNFALKYEKSKQKLENLKASLDELGSGFQIICLTKS